MNILEKIEKSPNDTLKYLAYELQNNLKVVFIEDKECKISSAVMNVDVGGFDDPIEYQGLAHFLEHMLFMGTKKYPDEKKFSEFISLNGGEQNAWTNFTSTIYYFTVNSSQINTALDIFSRFFIDPLFKKEFVDKEINSIESEHQKDFYVDDWRLQQIISEISHEKSLLRRFLNGSQKTLNKKNIYDELRKFHENFYSSNRMTLVVYHNKIDDKFINEVNNIFKQIINKHLPQKNYDKFQQPFDKANTSKYIQFKSIQKQKKLSFNWFVEQQKQHYKSPCLKILSHLLGHESEGTLYKILFDKNLIFELATSSYNCDDYYSEFSIELNLTQKGFDNKLEIISIVSGYIQMLQKIGIPQWVFQELKTINELNYLYKPKQNPINKCLEIAELASSYPIQEINKIGYMLDNFNKDYLQKLLLFLNSDNLILIESADVFGEFRFHEQHYNMTYECQDLPKIFKDTFDKQKQLEGCNLPPQNHFIPVNFDLINTSDIQDKYPQKIHEEFQDEQQTGILFYLPDTKFKLPQIEIQYVFYNIENFENICKQQMFNELWKKICLQHLNNFIYLADMAYIRLEINNITKGFQIQCRGYSDKLTDFLISFAEKLKEFRNFQNIQYLEELFNKFKKKQILNIDKQKKKKAYSQTLKSRNYILQDNCYSPDDQLKILQQINFDDYLKYHRDQLKSFHYQGLILGNINKQDSYNFNDKFIKILNEGNQYFSELQIRNIKLKKNQKFISKNILSNKKDKNNCILIMYELKNTLINNCFSQMLDHIFESSFFENLRTQQQLGYIVTSLFTFINKVPYMHFLVQSNNYSSLYCSQQIQNYLNNFQNELENISDVKFNQVKESMIANLEKKFDNLREESNFYLEQIFKKDYNFAINEQKIQIIKKITKQQVNDFYQKFFLLQKKNIEIHFLNQNSVQQFDKEFQNLKKEDGIQLFNNYKILKRKSMLHQDYFFQYQLIQIY